MNAPYNRVIVFIDGQNLFHLAKDAWGEGYHWPNYDPLALANELTALAPDRILRQVRFYSGVPDPDQNSHWHRFWTRKMRAMSSQGVGIYKGRILDGREKGVDVKIALDLVRTAREELCDTAIVVSQDSDLNEALREVLAIASEQGRQVILESAFPYEDRRGISDRGLTPSTWRRITKDLYDKCRDPHNYTTQDELKTSITIDDLKSKFNR